MTPPFFGEYGNFITFSTGEDCRPDAPEIAWWPESIAFRKSKEQGERFVLNLYLKWVFATAPFAFELPMQISRADGQGEPDFAVCENGRPYGLEIARATTWRDERALDELIKVGAEFCSGIDSDLDGEDRNYDPQADIFPVGFPFYGKALLGLDLEHKWAKCTAYRISEKQKKLKTNYSKFLASCDLVLYSACSVGDLKAALELLQSERSTLAGSSQSEFLFQRIAIICENWAIFDKIGTTPQIFASNHFNPQGNLVVN